MNLDITPVNARLLGSCPKRNLTASGLHLPDSAKQDQSMLTVVKLGNQAPDFDLQVDDRICIATGLMIHEDNASAYFIVKYEDVLAILRN